MKKFILLLIIILGVNQISAQVMRGSVLDAMTGKPIHFANVYLDGTSLSTQTDINGKFTLNVGKFINTKLIISHLSYQSEMVAKPFEQIPEKIYLFEKTNMLSEVVVSLGKFNRAQLMKAFHEQFLGRTKAGRSCKILNEDDIILRYDNSTKTLSASSENSLMIENVYLGYRLDFGMIEFYAQFVGETIEDEYLKRSFFLGTSAFTDLKPGDKKIKSHRDEVYKLSAINFFKNFAKGTLKDAGYMMFHKGAQVNPNYYFTVGDSLAMRIIRITPGTGIENHMGFGGKNRIGGKITILQNRKYQSDVIFNTDRLLVDEFGNTDAQDVFFSGHLGQLRVGDMLPLDYDYRK